MSEKTTLPTLIDLVSDVDIYQKNDKLNFLLNQEVPKKWIKTHPFIKNHNYIPIDKVEFLLRKIFKQYKIEILREGTSFNGVYVCVRVHYLNPTNEQWDFHDGIGAIQLQVKKGSSPSDLANINNGALSMAFPLAKTLAIKDACDMFGNLFGANLNRRDVLPASMDVKKTEVDPIDERILSLLNDVKNQDDLDFVKGLKEAQTEEYLSIIKGIQIKLNKKNK
jgi:hypothetical protein